MSFKGNASGKSTIVLLGTGTPNPDPERSGPGVAILVDDQPYLVDFGPGLVRRASSAHLAGIKGLDPKGLNRAFATHLHSDHTAGLPDLLLTPWVMGREEPLELYGPPGIGSMAEHIRAAYREDIRVRSDKLQPANDTGHYIRATEIEPGVIYQDDHIKVEAFAGNHGPWPVFSYKFHTPDRVIAVSGDAAPNDNYLEAYGECDVIIHEVYSSQGFQTIPEEWQRYHAKMHTSANELANMVSQTRPGVLILYHHLFFGVTEEVLLSEVSEKYDGTVISGQDLGVY